MSHHYIDESPHFTKLVVHEPDLGYGGEKIVNFQFGSSISADAKVLFVNIGDSLRAVKGEDLYALRHLLDTDLSEGAFVEPAPSVEVPDWRDGDQVDALVDPEIGAHALQAGLLCTYIRTGGEWLRISVRDGVTHGEGEGFTDGMIDAKVKAHSRYVVKRKNGVVQ